MESALIKTTLHNSIAEGLYKEIVNRTSRYYYFLGKTISWTDDATPPFATDDIAYEMDTRRDIITTKQIVPSDVSFVVNRINWTSGNVYDMYDDKYSDRVIGVNLQSSSSGHSSGTPPTITFGDCNCTGGTAWVASASVNMGDIIFVGTRYYTYTALSAGTLGSVAPTHTTGTVNNLTAVTIWTASASVIANQIVFISNRYYKVISIGTLGVTVPIHTSGTDVSGTATLLYLGTLPNVATANAIVVLEQITSIVMDNLGYGYTTAPTVRFSGSNGTSPIVTSIIGKAASGAQKLEDSLYYVLTDDSYVYKCLDNNHRPDLPLNPNTPSTVKPYGTDPINAIRTADGYVWKFMYAVPPALKNKFLTTTQMPVLNSLKSAFYSDGEVLQVNVTNSGAGYTYASATIEGDGYAPKDPVYIMKDVTVLNGGSGYTTPVVTVSPPFVDITAWVSGAGGIINQKVSYGNNIYRVAIAGTFGSSPPVHVDGFANNGSAALEFIGETPTATATTVGGVIKFINLIGRVRAARVIVGGSGYTKAPDVIISAGGGANARGSARLLNGAVIAIDISNEGVGYTSDPEIQIGTAWQEGGVVVSTTDQIFYGKYLYTVTSGGTLNPVSPPTHTSGSAVSGTATLAYAGIAANAEIILRYGRGYSSTPTITVTGGVSNASVQAATVKSNATIIPIVSNGQIVDVQIVDPGIGYTNALITMYGDGSQAATLTADFSYGNLETLQSNVELLTIDGAIRAIPVISGGFNYTGVTSVTITGDGTGATVKPEDVTIVNNKITKIKVTTAGSGYRWANITIVGSGVGATARAIISPVGGHGKNAINELFARTLVFYNTIAGEKNQGFDVSNDYRQLGIIKNPKQYSSINNYIQSIGSSCWVIGGVINTLTFLKDTDLVDTNGKRYRVVNTTSTSALLQSLDNAVPAVDTIFYKATNNLQFFTATAVTPPTFDKYSGDMLYIDNRAAFQPAKDETISLRTVIKF